jgi:hypothetical protein
MKRPSVGTEPGDDGTFSSFWDQSVGTRPRPPCNNRSLKKEESVRTTVDIPRPLYRKLKEQAAARGSSVRELVLAGVKTVLLQGQKPRSRRVRFPLIVSRSPKVNVTNEGIYEHVEFP